MVPICSSISFTLHKNQIHGKTLIETVRGKVGKILEDIDISKDFLNRTLVSQERMAKIDRLDFMK